MTDHRAVLDLLAERDRLAAEARRAAGPLAEQSRQGGGLDALLEGPRLTLEPCGTRAAEPRTPGSLFHLRPENVSMKLHRWLAPPLLLAAALTTGACDGEDCFVTGACDVARLRPPLEAPTASQKAHFRALAVSPDAPNYWPLILRWEGPVKVRIQAGGTAADTALVLALIDEFEPLTGRAIEFTAEGTPQIRIVYGTRDHFQGATNGPADGGMSSADAFIDPAYTGGERDAGTVRGMIQAFGLVGRTHSLAGFTDDDRYVLRAFYDDRVRSGMTLQEAETALGW